MNEPPPKKSLNDLCASMPRFTVLMDVMTSCRPCFHLSLLGLLALTSVGRGATEKLSFNRDIRPILSENCFACHGPDKNKRKGTELSPQRIGRIIRAELQLKVSERRRDGFWVYWNGPRMLGLSTRFGINPEDFKPAVKDNGNGSHSAPKQAGML